MADATRFRVETAEIAKGAGWSVTQMAEIDKFTRAGVSIEVAYSLKDYINEFFRDGGPVANTRISPKEPSEKLTCSGYG